MSWLEFKKNLNPGIKEDKVTKIGVFGHFVQNWSLKVSSFLQDHSVFSPLSKGGNPNFENFKKGGDLQKNFGLGETKKGA